MACNAEHGVFVELQTGELSMDFLKDRLNRNNR